MTRWPSPPVLAIPCGPWPASIVVLTLLVIGACGGDTITNGGDGEAASCTEAFISLESGDDQLGRPGQSLPQPVSVRLVDGSGEPLGVPGCEVRWTILDGGGQTAVESSTTDQSDRASVTWTLGDEEGVQTLRASAPSGLTAVALAVALDAPRPIVYVGNTGNRDPGGDSGALYMVDADGSNPTRITTGLHPDESPQWSPDGTKIAFIRRFIEICSSEQGDLMVMDVVGYTLTRLTDDGACAASSFGAAWAPDGESLVLERNRDLIEIDATTGARSSLVATSEPKLRPVWTSSGIVYGRRADVNEPTDLYLLDPISGTSQELLASGSDNNPLDASSDGSQVTVFRRSPAASFNFSLWIYDLETGDFGQIAGTARGWGAAFSPDDTHVVATLRGSLDGGPCDGIGDDYLVTIELSTGELTPITEPCGPIRSRVADWRPAG